MKRTRRKIRHLLLNVHLSDSTDRNSDFIKQEVTRLQDMLNRLDFKRKVGRHVAEKAINVLASQLICVSHLPQEILTKMDVAVKEIEDLMTSQLSPELQDWKRRQQISAIGGPLLTGLEQLQNWYSEY